MKLICATKNKGKIKEIKEILKEFDIVTLADLNYDDEIIENGNSFEENAIIKAKTIYDKYCIPVISDDSGLCVNSLFGLPGIYSHRFAREGATDDENNQKLVSMMKDITKRQAYFRCVICFYDGTPHLFNGYLYGTITRHKMGENGFGYDPYFMVDGTNKTLAMMDFEMKNKISHRKMALEKLKEYLNEVYSDI